jgi:hypothetical protein
MALATQDFQSRFFSNGAVSTFLISLPKWLTPDQRKIARENVQDIWSGPANAYKAQVLEGGMTATPVTMPLQDAQFLDLAKKTGRDIFGLYRVPPHMGGDLSESTNNNIEQQALEFVMYCMLPYLRKGEASGRKFLFKPADQKRFRILWNVEGLLRADAAARGELYSKMVQNGIMTRNEIRALENRNRSDVPGMDDYTVQTQLAPVDVLRKIAEEAAKPKPAPAIGAPGNQSPLKALENLMAEPREVRDVPEVHVHAPLTVEHDDSLVLAGLKQIADRLAVAPQVNVAPPQVNVTQDLGEVADMLRGLKAAVDRIGAERELVLDKDGNPTGSRIKG